MEREREEGVEGEDKGGEFRGVTFFMSIICCFSSWIGTSIQLFWWPAPEGGQGLSAKTSTGRRIRRGGP